MPSSAPSRAAGASPFALRRAETLAIPAAESARWDGVRALLVAQVTCGHLAAIALPKLSDLGSAAWPLRSFVVVFRALFHLGQPAAVLFVFLSGYFVGGPLWRAALEGGELAFAGFARRRALRLLPPLVLAVALGALLDWRAAIDPSIRPLYVERGYWQAMTPTNFAATLLCLQPTFANAFGSNGPVWTLGYIAQFYLFGFLAAAWARRRAAALALAAALYLLAAILRPEWAALFALWALGAVVRPLALAPALASAAPPLLLAGALLARWTPAAVSTALCGLVGVCLVAWVRRRAALRPVGASSWLRPLGGLAYEIYLVHYPLAFALYAAVLARPARSLAEALAFLLAALAAIGLAALALRTAAAALTPTT